MIAWFASPRARILLVGAAMSAFLVFAVLARATMLASAPTIEMRIEGFDPRAPLLGHFVQFRIMPDVASVEPASRVETEGEAWIRLSPAPGPELWTAALSAQRPLLAEGEQALRVRVAPFSFTPEADDVPVLYGVDRIYLSEGDARRIERALIDAMGNDDPTPPDVRVVLAVPEDGRPLVKGVSVDGETVLIGAL